ncbi:MAG: hypothetical protein NBKEAIPA_02331 [Nitrospirae bacterium]|nr:MAG: hypothetical protein UZ03_NOB001002313 [Nitrospira sp. OLB3]MBV6470416.1 hypothetical protein [Nitrospirota bacterium]MEB2339600.1 hypothetical protein [Nitrospirales bacterium]
MMETQIILSWATHNLLSAAAICFGGAVLIIMLYAYVHDYVVLGKHRT